MNNYWRKVINESLETIAMARRLAILRDGIPKQEIDDFILKEGNRQIEKFDNMGEFSLLDFMLKKVAQSIKEAKDEP